MQKCIKEDSVSPTLKSVVALLKLGDWDPDVFYKFRDVILNQVRKMGPSPRVACVIICQKRSVVCTV